jgi:O-antigen/teichoic acid export membrane protein
MNKLVSSLRETLAGAFGIMMVAVVVSSAVNYLFNIVMNRLLKTGSFGDLYSMETVFLIVTMCVLAAQTVITKYVAEFEAAGEHGRTRVMVRRFSRWLLIIGAAVLAFSLAVAWPVSEVLKLGSPLYVVILGTSVAVSVYLILPYGVLQGGQRFIGLGVAYIGAATLRISIGVLLVLLGLGVYGAIGAGTVAALIVVIVTMYFLRDLFKGPVEVDEEFHPGRAVRFFIPVALAMFFIILLSQMDVVLVKALFEPAEAGNYSYAALAGKAVLFLPEGILLVMFPRVSELRVKGEPTRRVLGWSLLAVSLLVVAVAGFYTIFPGFTAYFFAGEKGSQIVGLVGLFGFAMAMFAIVKLLAFYHLALEKKGFIWLFVVASVVEVAGIVLFHESLRQVVIVMILVGGLLLAANLVLAFKEEGEADGGGDSSDTGYLPI